jgi:hypothetical protein
MARPATSAVGLFTGRPGTASIRLLSGIREPVRLVSTVNVDMSIGGLLVVDGVQTVAGDRILLTAQTDATENGIYTAAAGPWYRATDARSPRAINLGVRVVVQEGAYAQTIWEFRTLLPDIGDDAISIVDVSVGTGGFGLHDMLTIGGTADAITATFNPPVALRSSGQLLRIRTAAANTGAMTLAADALPAAPILMPDGSAMPANAMQANTDYLLRDDGTNYLIFLSNITF